MQLTIFIKLVINGRLKVVMLAYFPA